TGRSLPVSSQSLNQISIIKSMGPEPNYFMYNWIATYSAYGGSKRGKTGDTVANDGSRLRKGLLNKRNATSPAWTDTAYRSKPHEAFMKRQGFVLKIHRKRPRSKSMLQRRQVRIYLRIGHIFCRLKVVIRFVGFTRATMGIGRANFNMRCRLFLRRINAAT
ncbi:hypothetical protein ACSW3B_15035, partial [Acetobacter senegalensis]